mgnify:CR=1 FL=1
MTERAGHGHDHQDNGFTLKLFGQSFSGRGMVALVALLIVLLVGLLGVGGWGIWAKAVAMEDQHTRIEEWVAALVYVNLLSDPDRQRLLKRMEVPKMLRSLQPTAREREAAP